MSESNNPTNNPATAQTSAYNGKIKKNQRQDRNATDDPAAPELYSQRAIMVFSVLFSVLAGGILMAINTKRCNLKPNNTTIWLFTVCYGAVIFTVAYFLPEGGGGNGAIIGLNVGGGYLLTNTFWNSHIGPETPYRKRAIWVPLLICILITAPIMLLAVYSMMQAG